MLSVCVCVEHKLYAYDKKVIQDRINTQSNGKTLLFIFITKENYYTIYKNVKGFEICDIYFKIMYFFSISIFLPNVLKITHH